MVGNVCNDEGIDMIIKSNVTHCQAICTDNPHCNFFSINDINACKLFECCDAATTGNAKHPKTIFKKTKGEPYHILLIKGVYAIHRYSLIYKALI